MAPSSLKMLFRSCLALKSWGHLIYMQDLGLLFMLILFNRYYERIMSGFSQINVGKNIRVRI